MAIDLYNLILTAKIQKGEGGGGDIDVDALNVSENGTYTASSGHAYSPVKVSVPTGVFPSGTSQITSNGIYDVSNYASASVNVPIPSGYIQPTGTSSITENGIYNISSFASVDVNVAGGGGDGDEIIAGIIGRSISGSLYNSIASCVGSFTFYRCWYLTEVNFPKVRAVSSSAFYSCSNLTKVSLPYSSTLTYTTVGIGEAAFDNCRNLEEIYCPIAGGVGNNAFRSCYKLSQFITTRGGAIAKNAFDSCSALALVSLGTNITDIDQSAFRNCSQLMSVYLLRSQVVTLYNSNTFGGTPMKDSSYTGSFGSIYVPASLVESYKTANYWSYYADRITSYVE